MKKMAGWIFQQPHTGGYFLVVLNEKCDVMWINPVSGRCEIGERAHDVVEDWPQHAELITIRNPHE